MAGVLGLQVLPPGLSIARVRVRAHDPGVSTLERNGPPRSGCHKVFTENVLDGTKKWRREWDSNPRCRY